MKLEFAVECLYQLRHGRGSDCGRQANSRSEVVGLSEHPEHLRQAELLAANHENAEGLAAFRELCERQIPSLCAQWCWPEAPTCLNPFGEVCTRAEAALRRPSVGEEFQPCVPICLFRSRTT